MGLMPSRARRVIFVISGEIRRIGWYYSQVTAEAEDYGQDVA
jgi:hypothetical protein